MIACITEVSAATLELARKVADQIILDIQDDVLAVNPDDISTNIKYSRNRESIDKGLSGKLIFLMEMHCNSRDDRYLIATDAVFDALIAYCRSTPVFNYGLFSGRGGVVYALIQRYKINNDSQYLKTAVELLLPASKLFLKSRYTSDYLFDGRSGVLLILLELYLLSDDDVLIAPINEFIDVILGNALISSEGLFWKAEEELGLRANCGLGYGVAGIQYVFRKLNAYTRNRGINYVLDGMQSYIDSCWNATATTWMYYGRGIGNKETLDRYQLASRAKDESVFYGAPDFSWANGAAGILLSQHGEENERSRTVLNEIRDHLTAGGSGKSTLFEGDAGIGAALPEFWEQLTSPSLLALQRKLLFRLQKLSRFDGDGLFDGELGCLYFLLRSQAPANTDSVLLPFAGNSKEKVARSVLISTTLPRVRKQMFRQFFPRVIDMLDTFDLTVSQPFWDAADPLFLGVEIDEFGKFAKTVITQMPAESMRAPMLDLLALETAKVLYFQTHYRSSLEIHLEEIARRERVMSDLNKPDEWLLRQPYSLSIDNGFFRTRWNWSLTAEGSILDEDQMRALHPLNLSLPAGEFEYIFGISNRLEERETCFTAAFRALLHCFDTPCSPLEAIVKVKSYMQSLPEELLRLMLNELKISSDYQTHDFLSLLDKEIFSTIKKWIYRGIIVK